MSIYLLLRDNKESGPYTQEELVTLGLKAYDLIWIKGKSAAWRYPSEISELKSFAPIVEEQPFDRFYKKNEEAPEPLPFVCLAPKKEKKEPETGKSHERYMPKPSVFVTMPAAEKKQTPPLPPQPINETEEPGARPTIVVSENPAAAQIKYSQPLDEIKEMYVKTLQERKQKIAFRGVMMQSLKKASVILVLVLLGVVTGFMLRSAKEGIAAVGSTALNQPKEEIAGISQPNGIDDETNNEIHSGEPSETAAISNSNEVNEMEIRNVEVPRTREEKEQLSQRLHQKQLLIAQPEDNITNTYPFQNSETDSRSGERTRNSRENNEGVSSLTGRDIKDVNVTRKAHPLASKVTVKSNDYRKVAFGGIRDLQLTVTNNSNVLLDEVIVELQYLKPSELPLRTENIRFNAIEPNSSATIKIPDTNRGIKVTYRVTDIRSRLEE